jgi:S-DNA-T family DNA segregation ATPase FtsK/SpoIIIE
MLFIPPGTATLVRAQGAFVSDEEINGIVEYLQENNEPPNFAQEVQQQINSSVEEGSGPGGLTGGDGDDEEAQLLAQAIDVLRSTKRASTSMLQRRLRIGYNRAARLMDELEERGIVGPENGSSPARNPRGSRCDVIYGNYTVFGVIKRKFPKTYFFIY